MTTTPAPAVARGQVWVQKPPKKPREGQALRSVQVLCDPYKHLGETWVGIGPVPGEPGRKRYITLGGFLHKFTPTTETE